MNHRDLIRAALLAFVLLVGANAAVRRLSSNSVPRQWLGRLSAEAPRRDTLFLGNSVVAAGINCDEFDRVLGQPLSGKGSLNGGLGGTGPLQALIGWRHVMAGGHHLRTLYYGAIDLMLTEEDQGGVWRSALGANAVIFLRFPEVAAEYLGLGSLERTWFLIVGRIPFFVERNSAWSKVELLRRWLGQLGRAHQEQNRFGRVEDFKQLVSGNLGRSAAVGQQRLRQDVRTILAEARSSGIRTRVVLLPVHPSRFPEIRDPGWIRYVEQLKGLLAREGAELVVASDWIRDEAAFTDFLHLNEKGAAEFSRLLARAERTASPEPR